MRYAHILRPNKGVSWPRNWVYFDTEALRDTSVPKVETQTLRLGVYCYHRFACHNQKAIDRWGEFTKPVDFWEGILCHAEKDRRLVIIGYNVGYDIRLVDGFHILADMGYEMTACYVGQSCLILRFKGHKRTIIVLDAMNYFLGKLEDWGETIGIPKVAVDFDTVDDDTLWEHCRVDVEILRAIMLEWVGFIQENNLGHFRPTKASQALSAFTHRFMDHDIFIHNTDEATEIERAAYVGGRVECGHIGKVPGGPFMKVDVNSMYPYVMQQTPVPVKFKGIGHALTVARARALLGKYALIAEVEIMTRTPAYPVKQEHRTIWPIGHFRTTLCGPELELALQRGHVKRFGRVCVYEQAIIFKRYIGAMYELRQAYKDEGNEPFQQLAKYMMCVLHGKFGQRSEQWARLGGVESTEDEYWIIYDLDSGKKRTFLSIAGQVWEQTGREESRHSFCGISSYICSAARVYLWKLILRAGRKNVFYYDTDSLIVNCAGADRLQSLCDNTALGKLKVEYRTVSLEILSPKEYTTDTETKRKGVRPDAICLKANKFLTKRWQGLRGALHDGTLDRVIIRDQVKILGHEYKKGIVHPSGSVSPVVLAAASDSSIRS